jgi:hypothetical protein
MKCGDALWDERDGGSGVLSSSCSMLVNQLPVSLRLSSTIELSLAALLNILFAHLAPRPWSVHRVLLGRACLDDLRSTIPTRMLQGLARTALVLLVYLYLGFMNCHTAISSSGAGGPLS